VMDLHPEEVADLMKRVEAERRRGILENELSLLNLSSLIWAKPAEKRRRLSAIQRELKEING